MMKPFRLAIIGAENSHSLNIATICNVLEKVPMRVTHLWGETKELADCVAEKARIPKVVVNWEQITDVDGVMIDHRDGNLHFDPAEYFIGRGLPTFVDKPITCDLVRSRKLLRQSKTPVLTFSSKVLQEGFRQFENGLGLPESGRLLTLNTSGPGDIYSQWGGIFFYGIHQVDSIVQLMGEKVKTVSLHASGRNAVATINYSDGRLATMNFINDETQEFHWYAHTDKKAITFNDKSDELPYLPSANLILDLLKDGRVPFTAERMLAPIAILEALDKSLKSGNPETVAPL